MAQCNVQSLLSNSQCFGCLSPGEWDIIELQLLCEILNAGGGSGLSLKTATMPLDNSTLVYSFRHGLPNVPVIVRAVFLCVSNDLNLHYSVGDEATCTDTLTFTVSTFPGCQIWSNITFINVSFPIALVGHENNYNIMGANGNNITSPVSFNNFSLKIYYA